MYVNVTQSKASHAHTVGQLVSQPARQPTGSVGASDSGAPRRGRFYPPRVRVRVTARRSGMNGATDAQWGMNDVQPSRAALARARGSCGSGGRAKERGESDSPRARLGIYVVSRQIGSSVSTRQRYACVALHACDRHVYDENHGWDTCRAVLAPTTGAPSGSDHSIGGCTYGASWWVNNTCCVIFLWFDRACRKPCNVRHL